jgi:N-acetylglutamate synthase-like GNAT family acetyltransferase
MALAMPEPFIRAAHAADQAPIRRIIGQARLNPLGLHWQRFIVAEEAGQVIGVGQIKPHDDGTLELASLAIVPERQSAGIGGALMWTLLARAPGPLYLRCASHNEAYYLRFGFRTLAYAEMPPSHRRVYRLANILIAVINRFSRDPERLHIMGRNLSDPSGPGQSVRAGSVSAR